MRSQIKILLAPAALVLLALAGFAPGLLAQGKDQGKIVIVFKDGRQQSFPLAEIARIEFQDVAVAASAVGSARFLGQWKVGDGAGGTFEITLKPDGKAHKTLGSPDGTWRVEKGEARITWEDGWKDLIRKSGGKYQKLAFRPGTSFDDPPSNVAEAEYTEAH